MEQRLSAADALEHPWLKDLAPKSSESGMLNTFHAAM